MAKKTSDIREVLVQVKVKAPRKISVGQIPGLVDMLIGAGLTDAEESSELAEEDRDPNTEDALSLEFGPSSVVGWKTKCDSD